MVVGRKGESFFSFGGGGASAGGKKGALAGEGFSDKKDKVDSR